MYATTLSGTSCACRGNRPPPGRILAEHRNPAEWRQSCCQETRASGHSTKPCRSSWVGQIAICTSLSFTERSMVSHTRAASASRIIPIRSDSQTFACNLTKGFKYVYDPGDNWEHDIRVEKLLVLDPARAYPVSIGGAQPCPPEDSGGPWRMSLRHTRKPGRRRQETRSPGKANDTEDQFDPDSVNSLLRDLQSGWLRRFDEVK